MKLPKYAGNPEIVNEVLVVVPIVPVSREKRKSSAVAVALIPLVPVAAPVIFARIICPASRSPLLRNPAGPLPLGTPDCPVKIPESTLKVALEPSVKQIPLPKLALVNGDPLVKIALSLRIIP